MESNVPQRMLFQQIAEVGADVVWFEQIAQRVRADVVFPLWVIRFPKHFFIQILFDLNRLQHFINRIGDRQRAAARFIRQK